MEWFALAAQQGLDETSRREAVDRLASNGLITVTPTTGALTLTFKGVDLAEALIAKERSRSLADPLPKTRDLVRDDLEYWAHHQHDGEPGSNHWIAVESRLTNLRHLDDTMIKEANTSLANQCGLAVFISHSSIDELLARALIDLLKSAVGLLASQIRCSSVDGYKLSVGVNTEDQLRQEVNAAEVVVGLVTPSSLASHFVMFELGARWGAKRLMAPLLAGIDPCDLKPPLALLNALSAHSEHHLHQLVRDIADILGVPLQNTASYLQNITATKQQADRTERLSSLQREKESLTAENLVLKQTLQLKAAVCRISGHSYIDGEDDEICPVCVAIADVAIPLVDLNIDGRGKKASCPKCKTPIHEGPPISRHKAEAVAGRTKSLS